MSVVLIALLLASTATAEEPPQRYLIEVLLFAREVPPNPHYRFAGEPRNDDAIELIPEEEFDRDETPLPVLSVERPFQPVALEGLQRVADRLDRLPRYRLLGVQAWTQEAEVFGEARAVRIHGTRDVEGTLVAPPIETEQSRDDVPGLLFGDTLTAPVEDEPDTTWEIEGSATFERGRFPHLGLDLVFRRAREGRGYGDGASLAPVAALDDLPYQAYRIRQRQRLVLGEAQYFDHQQFGAIALVTEIETDRGQDGLEN